jgi:hypothetical protein
MSNTPADYTAQEHHLAGNPAVAVVRGPRRSLLLEAADLVDGDRNAQYGDPVDDFRRTAAYWSTHIGGVLRRKANECRVELSEDVLDLIDRLLDPHDVAVMMQQLKLSRLAWSPNKRDSWIDAAGYVACGWDCVVAEQP